MKSKKKLGLRIRTIRDLDHVTGGAFRGNLDDRLAEIRRGLGGGLGKESDEKTCTTDTTSNDNHCPCSRRREETCPPPTVFEGVLNRFTIR